MYHIIDKYIEMAKKNNPNNPEFIQTVTEVFSSVEPLIKAHPEYEEEKVLEKLIEPERMLSFEVPWVDDKGIPHINHGYRCQFNSVLGPYKGGLRFHPSVYEGTVKFLAFEQTFKNSLTGQPLGGGKGGADFDPTGKSEEEIKRFSESFISQLYPYIGIDTDVPAGDIGVGTKEVGYMYKKYMELTGKDDGALSGKPLNLGGLRGRAEATGFGLVTFLLEILKHENDSFDGKTIVVSGYGNVAWGTIKKLNMLNAKVITISGHDGYILDEDGIKGDKVDFLLKLKNERLPLREYANKYPNAKFIENRKPWEVKGDIYIPCATQNEINLEDAKLLISNGIKYLIEGSNMPTSNEAISLLQENNVIVAPSKAANAGGVSCSYIEMCQNMEHTTYEEDLVYKKLDEIMINIHKLSMEASEKYGLGYDLVKGANIAGFERVATAMLKK